MKKNIFTFIGIGLITGALMWGLVQASGVQINRTPSLDDNGTRINVSSAIVANFIPQAATDVNGLSHLLEGQNAGDCSACEEQGPAGGNSSLAGGDGGNGTASIPAGGGGGVSLTGGQAGDQVASGGVGNGGSVVITGGSPGGGGSTGNQGQVTISGRRILLSTNSAVRFELDINGDLLPFATGQGTLGGSSNHIEAVTSRVYINPNTPTTLGVAETTFALITSFHTVTGDSGTNTLATITGAIAAGQTINLLFVDALVTITDDDTHAADSVDLSAAFTSADDTILTLLYDGTSWYETSRSVN